MASSDKTSSTVELVAEQAVVEGVITSYSSSPFSLEHDHSKTSTAEKEKENNVSTGVVLDKDDTSIVDLVEAVEVKPDDTNNKNNSTTTTTCFGIPQHGWMIIFVMVCLGIVAAVLGTTHLSSKSKATTLDTTTKFKEFVDRFGQNVTKDIRVFNDPFSPQYATMNWLANFDTYVPNADYKDDDGFLLDQHYMERYAVALICFSMRGTSTTDNGIPNVLSPVPVCEWNDGSSSAYPYSCAKDELDCMNFVLGVACNDNKVVTVMNFEGLGLCGSIPSEIGLLTSLERVIFDDNTDIKGSIPDEIYHLTNMVRLSLNDCSVTGTLSSAISKLTDLVYLNMNGNALSGGSLPSEIGKLTNLKSLTLSENQFTGSIPTEIGQLSQLTIFEVGNCGMTGSMQSLLGQLNLLEHLSLYSNNFGGTLPVEIGHLTQLTRIDLSYNSLTGTIPSEIGLLKQLNTLHFHRNSFSGTLPLELGQLTLVKEFQVDHNFLSGTIPKELGSLPVEDVRLHFNNFSGSLDDVFCNATETVTQMVLYADCGENQPLQCACCLCCPALSEC